MKEPEVLEKIVKHHCLSYEIVFQLIKKNILTTPISIIVTNCGKKLFFYKKLLLKVTSATKLFFAIK